MALLFYLHYHLYSQAVHSTSLVSVLHLFSVDRRLFLISFAEVLESIQLSLDDWQKCTLDRSPQDTNAEFTHTLGDTWMLLESVPNYLEKAIMVRICIHTMDRIRIEK